MIGPRHSISQKEEDEPRTARWKNFADSEFSGGESSNVQTMKFTLLPVNSNNLYARRHSSHNCGSVTNEQNTHISQPPPPSQPAKPPTVPKRTYKPQTSPKSLDTPKLVSSIPAPNSGSRGSPPVPPPRSPASLLNSRAIVTSGNVRKAVTVRPSVTKTSVTPNDVFLFDANIMHEFGKIPPPPVDPPPPAPKPKINPGKYVFSNTSPNQPSQQPTQQQPTKQTILRNSNRQDSSISSDSFSQNSSPSYTSKTMEIPLLPPRTPKHPRLTTSAPKGSEDSNSNAALTKSASTPASLQTIVKYNGSNMSLHHRIIRDVRRSSSHHYVRNVKLKIHFAQMVINAVALIAIGGAMAAYFKAYPLAMHVVNNTFNSTYAIQQPEKLPLNPAPGICLPVIVGFCQQHHIPYNYTVFPNYMGHFGQPDAQHELEVYDAIVDVRCYELAALFLCSVFVPKCGTGGIVVRPCRSLCFEMKRRCGFFLDVFGLSLPDYLECALFPESPDPNTCVGHEQVKEAKIRSVKPSCNSGFQCDVRRCIPSDWLCDGYVDCKDQSDELNCDACQKGMIHCGERTCITQNQMCDGRVDCPYAQDERNCLRLSNQNGDEGRGQLQVYRPDLKQWIPACVSQWNPQTTPNTFCSLLGYSNVISSKLVEGNDDVSVSFPVQETTSIWRMHQNRKTKNLLKEFSSCSGTEYPTVDLVCSKYMCGKPRLTYAQRRTLRIVGGVKAKPGDWPFLAALLGGPEEIFYCAGVLIADQWVLTASHCVGNHSDVSGWTIQLGITRRHAHSYYGQKAKVKRVVPHPMYNMGIAHDNDVALFQLSTPVTFHEHLLPVCLPSPDKELKPGTVCTVIGWGKKEDTGMSEYEPEINEVEVPVLNRDLCNVWLENRDLNVTEGMICAGYKEGGRDACQGDSGGPLLCRDENDRWFVGGIVSWGIKCAHPHLPGVYAYVPKYIPWILHQMSQYS